MAGVRPRTPRSRRSSSSTRATSPFAASSAPALDSLFRRRPPIEPMDHREGIFDRVILVCPVWGGRMAGPARTWLARLRARHQDPRPCPSCPATASPIPACSANSRTVIGRSPKPLLTMSEYDFGNRDRRAEGRRFRPLDHHRAGEVPGRLAGGAVVPARRRPAARRRCPSPTRRRSSASATRNPASAPCRLRSSTPPCAHWSAPPAG